MELKKNRSFQFFIGLIFIFGYFKGMTQESSVLVLNGDSEIYQLGKSSAIFIDSSKTVSFDQIRTAEYQSQFVLSKVNAHSLGVIEDIVWLKFELDITGKATENEWLVTLDYPLFDYVTFYQKDKEQVWSAVETGDKFLFSHREIPNRNFIFPLNIQEDGNTVFYLRFATSGSMQIHPELYTERAFLKADNLAELGYGLFFGGLLFIMFYNFFLLISLKDWAYVFYCLFILVTILQQAAFSGHLNQFVFTENEYWINQHIPIVMVLNALTIALFTIVFLKTKKYAPFWYKILFGLSVLCCLHCFAIFFLPLRSSIPISGLLTSIALLVAVGAGISALRNGNKSARFYLLAWSILFISSIFNALRLFGIFPNNMVTVHFIKIGIVFESIVLALALADKYNLFKKEKEATQAEMIRLQENTNRDLEEKVKARTLELANTNDKLSQTLEKVEEERAKSDKLLLNILPAETAAELKENGVSAPKQYHLATVLFTDFKNFTTLVDALPPTKTIEVLDICFLAFDEICERNNIEKIKTIGDSYMAAGGLPIANTSNPVDAVRAAIEIQEWMANWDQSDYDIPNQKWELRIGIHTGPVMAGVVGKNKFAYDIWGDTVNIASRMESTGAVGKVSISKKTYELVKDHFHCEYYGKVQAKNIGEIDSYWVLGVKEEVRT